MEERNAVKDETLEIVRRLCADEAFEDFALVGGTALAIHIGHRVSIDIDMFTDKDFESTLLAAHLAEFHDAKNIRVLKNGIFCFIGEVKIDIISHKYPLQSPILFNDGIRLAALEDIGAMKLQAIMQSGARLKDFVDMYFLLENMSLNTMLDAFEAKYPDVNRSIGKNALIYFNDISFRKAEVILLHRKFSFPDIERGLKAAVLQPDKIFSTASLNKSKGKKM